VCGLKENIESRNVNFMFHYNYVVRFNTALFSSTELQACKLDSGKGFDLCTSVVLENVQSVFQMTVVCFQV
jgi:hypothetical protein